MKLYAPVYYNEFKCIADKCSHSCCIGWRVALDDATKEKYEHAEGDYAKSMRENIEVDEEGTFIPTLRSGRCPHLDECGLCRIICEYGEGYLSDICREHPRFYNYTAERAEVGIGASCPEAARLILSADYHIREIGVIADADSEGDFYDSPALRDEIYNEADRVRGYAELREWLLDRLNIPASVLSKKLRTDSLSALEYLYDDNKALILSSAENDPPCDDKRLIRVLLYFIFRHLTEAVNEADARARVGFALFSAEAVATLSTLTNDLAEALRIYSEEIEYSPDNTESVLFDIENDMI